MTLKLAVVTGGGAGLGKIIVGRLAGQGAHVVIADLDREAGSVVADQVQQTAGRATFVQTDMSEEKEVRQLMQRVAGLGPLSLLVNNAGGWHPDHSSPTPRTGAAARTSTYGCRCWRPNWRSRC
jgi:NAD(P)-dependent dehydrogenase (short-subunit alcohol dehydrogenase family)